MPTFFGRCFRTLSWVVVFLLAAVQVIGAHSSYGSPGGEYWEAFSWAGYGGVLGHEEGQFGRTFWGSMGVAGILITVLFALGFSWARGLLALHLALHTAGILFSGIWVSDQTTGFVGGLAHQLIIALLTLSFVPPASRLFSTWGPVKRGGIVSCRWRRTPHGAISLALILALVAAWFFLVIWMTNKPWAEFRASTWMTAAYAAGMMGVVLGAFGAIGLAVWAICKKRGAAWAWAGMTLSVLVLCGAVIQSLPFEAPRAMEEDIMDAYSNLQKVVDEEEMLDSIKVQAMDKGIEYSQALRAAMASGGEGALADLMNLDFDGEESAAHASVLANLLIYLGDSRFASALKAQPERVQKNVTMHIDSAYPDLLQHCPRMSEFVPPGTTGE